jgi:hypothetical protein
MKLELKIFAPNEATDSGWEYIGSVNSADGAPVTLKPGSNGSTAGLVSEISAYDVKKFPSGDPATVSDGHDFVIGLALFYLQNRNEAVLFADGESISWSDAQERLYPASTERK